MPLPFGVLKTGDLNAVNFSVTGSKRSAPSGADTQILPLPSQSTVVAPPVGDMPSGGRKVSIFSVLGSSRHSAPRPTLQLNQMMPLGSRVMPWVLAARPLAENTLNILTLPVLASMRPTEVSWLGTFEVNHRLPSRSGQASCTSDPRRDGVPLSQSLPSLVGVLAGTVMSASSGTSYSLNTTRAVSPAGRGRSTIFAALSPGPRTRAR